MRRIRYMVSVVFMVSGLLMFFQNCSPTPEVIELQALSHNESGRSTAAHLDSDLDPYSRFAPDEE